MIIEDEFEVSAPRDALISFLLDTSRVQRCVPGLQDLTETSPDRYEATLAISVGPIRSQFEGTLQLDRSGAPSLLIANAQGKDRQTGSVAKVSVESSLEPTPKGSTRVSFKSDVTLRGRLGQFGTGVIRATAAEMMKEFAACAESQLASEESAGERASGPARRETAAPRKQATLTIILLRTLRTYGLTILGAGWKAIRDFFKRITDRDRP